MRNPIISSVVYLQSAAAGQTGTDAGGGCHSSAGGGANSGQACANGSSGGSGGISSSSSGPSGAGQPLFVGGPTLVSDQSLGGPLARHGWLAYPAMGRVAVFDGSVLHGGWTHLS